MHDRSSRKSHDTVGWCPTGQRVDPSPWLRPGRAPTQPPEETGRRKAFRPAHSVCWLRPSPGVTPPLSRLGHAPQSSTRRRAPSRAWLKKVEKQTASSSLSSVHTVVEVVFHPLRRSSPIRIRRRGLDLEMNDVRSWIPISVRECPTPLETGL